MKPLLNKWLAAGVLLVPLLLTGCLPVRTPGAVSADGTDTNLVATVTRGPLSVTISAIGNVRPAQSVTLAWQTSGKVGEVSAQIGQAVAQDDVLAVLDPTTLSNSILQAQTDLINAQNTLEELQIPDPLKIAQTEDALTQAQDALDALRSPSESAIAQAELSVINAQNDVDDKQYDLDSLLNGRGSPQLISPARANYLLAQDRVDRLQQVYNNTPGDVNEDVGKAQAFSSLEGAKKDRDRALASLNWYLGEPSEQELAEAQTNLTLAKAKLADAQKALEDLRSPTPSAIALAEARVEDAQQTLEDARRGASEDELTIAQNRVTQAQASVNLSRLTAPIDGKVTSVQILEGDLVSAGQQAFRIDDLSRLLLDLQVSEIDVQQIQVGQPVSVIFDAIPEQEYQGAVVEIGQIGISSQGVVNFTVTVQITDPDTNIKPGMTAEANIQVAEAADVLQIPSRFIFNDNGKNYVYRVNGEEVEQIFIQVGVSSTSASEVLSNELNEGDLVTTQEQGFFFGPGQGQRQPGGGQP
jgi:HlyD family secretion protein